MEILKGICLIYAKMSEYFLKNILLLSKSDSVSYTCKKMLIYKLDVYNAYTVLYTFDDRRRCPLRSPTKNIANDECIRNFTGTMTDTYTVNKMDENIYLQTHVQ